MHQVRLSPSCILGAMNMEQWPTCCDRRAPRNMDSSGSRGLAGDVTRRSDILAIIDSEIACLGLSVMSCRIAINLVLWAG
jgi:hypothetical protein